MGHVLFLLGLNDIVESNDVVVLVDMNPVCQSVAGRASLAAAKFACSLQPSDSLTFLATCRHKTDDGSEDSMVIGADNMLRWATLCTINR